MIAQDDWEDTLTPREAECLRLVLELHTNDAIAKELDLSTNTVRNHMKAARDKLGGLGRYEAAKRYVKLAGGSGPSQTSLEGIMAYSREIRSTTGAVRSSDVTGQSTFQETRAAYAHEDGMFDLRFNRAELAPEGGRTLFRILAVPTCAAVIALLIVATPPMAESFKRLAVVIAPFFK